MESTLVPIAISIGVFAMVFGLRYLVNKERMAMIERGLDPRIGQRPSSRPLQTLKWGMILCGTGIGLFIAFFLSNYVLMVPDDQQPAIYFGMIGICGGLGLIISYVFEKKHEESEKQKHGN